MGKKIFEVPLKSRCDGSEKLPISDGSGLAKAVSVGGIVAMDVSALFGSKRMKVTLQRLLSCNLYASINSIELFDHAKYSDHNILTSLTVANFYNGDGLLPALKFEVFDNDGSKNDTYYLTLLQEGNYIKGKDFYGVYYWDEADSDGDQITITTIKTFTSWTDEDIEDETPPETGGGETEEPTPTPPTPSVTSDLVVGSNTINNGDTSKEQHSVSSSQGTRTGRLYLFVPNTSGKYIFKFNDSNGSNIDTFGYIFSESMSEITSNDDGNTEGYQDPMMELPAVAGTKYYVLITEYRPSNTTVQGTLTIELESSSDSGSDSGSGGGSGSAGAYFYVRCPNGFSYVEVTTPNVTRQLVLTSHGTVRFDVNVGDEITLTASATTGYNFVNWMETTASGSTMPLSYNATTRPLMSEGRSGATFFPTHDN